MQLDIVQDSIYIWLCSDFYHLNMLQLLFFFFMDAWILISKRDLSFSWSSFYITYNISHKFLSVSSKDFYLHKAHFH